MKPAQLALISTVARAHGGSLRQGKRKIARPIDSKRALHVVLRSYRARGDWSMLTKRNKGIVALLVDDTAKRFGVKVYRFENVGNHLHILLRGRRRREIQNFLRVLPQRIMFQITGARKGNPRGRFWDVLAYSRVVQWGREFKIVKNYLGKNMLEALGLQWLLAYSDIPDS